MSSLLSSSSSDVFQNRSRDHNLSIDQTIHHALEKTLPVLLPYENAFVTILHTIAALDPNLRSIDTTETIDILKDNPPEFCYALLEASKIGMYEDVRGAEAKTSCNRYILSFHDRKTRDHYPSA